jgi:hypothetical protein
MDDLTAGEFVVAVLASGAEDVPRAQTMEEPKHGHQPLDVKGDGIAIVDAD